MGGAFDNASDPRVETSNLTRPSQQRALDTSLDFLTERIGQGGTPIPFDFIAELPQLLSDAFAQFETSFQGSGAQIQEALQGLFSGQGTFQPDVAGVKERFTQDVLNPSAQAIRDTLGEEVFNMQNQPGRFFATDVPENVGRAISQQLGLTTARDLAGAIESERNRGFVSQENLLSRQPNILAAQQQLPITQFQQAFQASTGFQGAQQNVFNRRAADFLRVNAPEEDPFLRLALGFPGLTSSTLQNILMPGQEAGQGQQIGLDLLGSFAGQSLGLSPSAFAQTGRPQTAPA